MSMQLPRITDDVATVARNGLKAARANDRDAALVCADRSSTQGSEKLDTESEAWLPKNQAIDPLGSREMGDGQPVVWTSARYCG